MDRFVLCWDGTSVIASTLRVTRKGKPNRPRHRIAALWREGINPKGRVWAAHYDEAAQRWLIGTSTGERVSTQFLICAVGTLSAFYKPNIAGLDIFAGECYHTGRWPQEPVSFAGKRVGVIGTGSSGVQAILEIAREAAHLTVFQRTPQYSIPARNRPVDPEMVRQARENWAAIREKMNASPVGSPFEVTERLAMMDTPEQQFPLSR